jgi:hypothetical protein
MIAVVLVIWCHSPGSGKPATDMEEAEITVLGAMEGPPGPPPESASESREDPGAGGAVPAVASAPSTVRQRFRDATNYAAFIDSVLSDARAGDMDAQYYVYAALSFCDAEFRFLFKRRVGTGWLTHDEAMNLAARRYGQSFSWTETVEKKCRTLMEGPRSGLGDSRKWLEDAAAQGQPVAMAMLADAQIIETATGRRDKAAAAGAANLLLSALESKDPEVMWKIGDLQGFLKPDSEESAKAQWAWWLAACDRGYECGPQALVMEFSCRYEACPPGETVVEYMKRFLQTDFPAVEDLAREINADIDAENWSELESLVGGNS